MGFCSVIWGGNYAFLLLLHRAADQVAHRGDHHAIDRGDAPVHQICYHRAEHHAEHREPVDRLADLHVLIFLLVQEVAEHQNNTHRWQRAVQDVQPAAEVPVQPDGEHRADDAGGKHHGLLFLAEDVGKAEARGIERVVVRRPDVQAQDQNGEVEQAKVDHHLEDVVAAHIDRRDTAEEEHQRVADEERDHRCDGAHLAAFGKAGEVRRRRAAGDERANDQSRAADHRQRAAGLGKLIDDRAVAAHDGEDHRDRTQYRHHRDGDIADDRIAQLGPLLAVIVDHIAQAVHKRLAGGDDVADQQRAVRHGGKLAVFDLKAPHLAVFKNALARHKADVVDADVLFVAALLQRVVQSAPQDREDIRRRDLLFLLQVTRKIKSWGYLFNWF